ncbi:F-actin-capping protein subunit beta [Candida albicans P75063]|nr:F-actin-capping protein subunit beta [Candida albicans P75063]
MTHHILPQYCVIWKSKLMIHSTFIETCIMRVVFQVSICGILSKKTRT